MFAWESTVPALARLPQDWTRHRLEGINPGVLLPPPKSLHRCSQERNRGTGRPSNGQPWERVSSCVISSETWSHCPNAAESIRVNCTGPIFRRPQCGLFIAMLTFICRGSARRRTSAIGRFAGWLLLAVQRPSIPTASNLTVDSRSSTLTSRSIFSTAEV